MCKADGVSARYRRRYQITTNNRHIHLVFANRRERGFPATAPNRLRVSEITCIWIREG